MAERIERHERKYVWKKRIVELAVVGLIVVASLVAVQIFAFNTSTVEDVSTPFEVGTEIGGVPAIGVVNVSANESEETEIEKIDTDGDGLSDYQEKQIGTDPNNVDTDGDWISDKVEMEIGTDPMKMDTDNDGIDDFNERYTYECLDPNDPTDAEKFMEMIPNVEARNWGYYDGGISLNCTTRAHRLNEVSKRDPLVQWYAEHTKIEWNTVLIKNGEYEEGKITVCGEPFRLGTRDNDHIKEYGALTPAYFLTHGRKGICGDCSTALKTLLELKNYDSVDVHGKIIDSGKGHMWIETFIDKQVYVGNGNTLTPRDIFYKQHNWTKTHIGADSYNPEWYLKEPST